MAHPTTKRTPMQGIRTTISIITAFLFGLALASAFFLWHAIHTIDAPAPGTPLGLAPLSPAMNSVRSAKGASAATNGAAVKVSNSDMAASTATAQYNVVHSTLLSGLRILVTIVSFDFMQLAHLEEVLDGFQDLCYAGSKVDIVIYTTVVVSAIRVESHLRLVVVIWKVLTPIVVD